MSRLMTWLAGGASAVVLVAFALPSAAIEPAMDRAPTPLPAIDGPTVYAETCAKCHGVDGKGDTGMGKKARAEGKNWPDLTQSKHDAAKTKAIIDDGVAGTMMKAYKDKLGADALKNVADFVLTLRAP